MHTCTWCGATGDIVHTRCDWDALPGQEPILLCLDRKGCLKRMTDQTERQLTGARP